jgi:hypothetical protein
MSEGTLLARSCAVTSIERSESLDARMRGEGCGLRGTDLIPMRTTVAAPASPRTITAMEDLMKRRFLSLGTLATAAGAAAALALAPLAAANAAYTHSTDDFEFDAGDTCPFSVHWTVHNEIDETALLPTGNGSIRIIHIVETDTLAANGATVHGVPYHYTIHVQRDSDGNFVRADATGVQLKFALPDGGIWTAGGVTDFLTFEQHGSWKLDDLGPVCDALAG